MRTALITGASSGIGESFARKLIQRGDKVVLVARSEDKLAKLCNELGKNAQYVAVDLSRDDGPGILASEASARGLEVDLLINNAGFGVMGDFAEREMGRQLNMIDLNVRALTELCYRFLIPMRERRRGAIINVASTAAFQAVPYMGAYAATKAYVMSLSEALWYENKDFGIRVFALCPGVTDTNFFEAADSPAPAMRVMQTADEVAETGLRALESGDGVTVSGWMNRLMTIAERAVPRSLVTIVAGKALKKQYSSKG